MHTLHQLRTSIPQQPQLKCYTHPRHGFYLCLTFMELAMCYIDSRSRIGEIVKRNFGGSTNRPRIVQLNFFWKISFTKSEYKGGPFYKKNCQILYLRPHIVGRFDVWGVCQLAHNGPIGNFFNVILHKIRIKLGSVL